MTIIQQVVTNKEHGSSVKYVLKRATHMTISLGVLSLSVSSVSALAATANNTLESLTQGNYLEGMVTPAKILETDFTAANDGSILLAKNSNTEGPAAAYLASTMPNSGIKTDQYPQTPKLNPKLPVIQVTHGSDHIKANILNPNPVCNSLEDRRTVVYRVTDNWLPVGTISTYNQTNSVIPLTQTTAKTQTISISVNGSQTETTTVNLGGNVSGGANGTTGGGSTGIAYSLARQIGGQAAYSLSWDVGQNIGPYDVPAGYTGEATYGFRAVNMTGTQQHCRPNGTWSTPIAWRAFVPIKNEVRVSLYDNLVDSIDTSVPDWSFSAPTPKPETNVDMTEPLLAQKLDLQPYMTVSGMKAKGFAGSAALHIKNVGLENYYGEFPVVSFLVEVKTASGPEGVDRVITPSWFKGAYVQDLGFDKESSTRSFLVTLSNPINVGEDVTVAAFSFNDGLTKLGRIKNYIKVSQVGRVAGDESYYNDLYVDSRTTTLNDFGRPIEGIF